MKWKRRHRPADTAVTPRTAEEQFTDDLAELTALAEKVYAVVPGLDEQRCRERLGRLEGEPPQRRPILDLGPDVGFW